LIFETTMRYPFSGRRHVGLDLPQVAVTAAAELATGAPDESLMIMSL
jgi:hypothetical protein